MFFTAEFFRLNPRTDFVKPLIPDFAVTAAHVLINTTLRAGLVAALVAISATPETSQSKIYTTTNDAAILPKV